MFLMIFMVKKINGRELQKINQQEFGIEKVIKKNETDYMLNEKVMTVQLIAGLKMLDKNEPILSQTIWTFRRRY